MPEKLAIGSNFALAESAGSIGLRTQSIQLMRDAMYRLCEGYLSGAINGSAFETLHRRSQSSMVAILAIEQLTGAVRAPSIVLGSESGAGDPQAVADLTQQAQQKRVAMNQAKTTKDAADVAAKKAADKAATAKGEEDKVKAKTSPVATTAELKTANEAVIKADAESAAKAAEATRATDLYTEAKGVYERFEAARMAAVAGVSTAKATYKVGADYNSGLSTAGVTSVANAVQGIVHQTLGLSFGRELCATVLLKDTVGSAVDAQAAVRWSYLDASAKRYRAEHDLGLARLDTARFPDNASLTPFMTTVSAARTLEDGFRSQLKPTSIVGSCLLYLDSSTTLLVSDQEARRLDAGDQPDSCAYRLGENRRTPLRHSESDVHAHREGQGAG